MDKDLVKVGVMGLCCLTFSMVLFSIMLMGIESYDIETPCVDGDGDVNLEGIMCEKSISFFFGHELDESNQGFLFIAVLAMGGTGIIGILALVSFLIFLFQMITQSSGGANK